MSMYLKYPKNDEKAWKDPSKVIQVVWPQEVCILATVRRTDWKEQQMVAGRLFRRLYYYKDTRCWQMELSTGG